MATKKINIATNSNIRKCIIICAILFALLLLSTIFALTNSFSEKIIAGISIYGIDISNLTVDEAYDKVKQAYDANIKKNINVKLNEYKTTISLEQVEVKYDIANAINEAYTIGRSKNIIINNYDIIVSKLFHKEIKNEIEINEIELDKIVEDISAKVPGIVEESSYYIEENNLIITNGKEGIKVKKDDFKNVIIDNIKKQMNGLEIKEINIPFEQKQPEEINVEKIRQEIYQEPQNAYYEEKTSKLYKEKNGIDFSISIEEAKAIVAEKKEEYIIPLAITKPEVTTNDLAKQDFFPEQISKFITRYDESDENRSTNIKLASEKINGTILMPGETFSYNKTVGQRTIKAGYKEASIYMNGKVVDGIGGGICQVSSTLYNAVLQANLEIVSRKNHYFVTGYVSPSRDATVSYGTIDFQFKNSRTYPIKIQCTSQNGICQIQIYGIKEEKEYEVVIEDAVTEIIPYTTRYVETNNLETGEEKEIQQGVNGYKSEAYRILKYNGQVISKTLLSKDSYNPLERIVEKGK